MRKELSILLAAAIGLSLLTGCGNTAGASSAPDEKQEQMIKAPEYSEAAAISVPDTFTGDWVGVDDCISVHANAVFELPAVESIPTATVERRSFTQADADRILSVFLKGNTLYEEQGITKQQAMERLAKYKAMQSGEIPLQGDTAMEKLPEVIEHYTELAETALDEGERIPVSLTFQTENGLERLQGCGEVDGREVHIHIVNWPTAVDQANIWVDGYADFNNSYGVPLEELSINLESNISEAEALKAGDELISALGFSNVVCDSVEPVAYMSEDMFMVSEETGFSGKAEITDTGYELEYTRCVEGMPIAHTPYTGGATPESIPNAETWEYERITVGVCSSGIAYFRWRSPYSEPVTGTYNCQLLDFDEVADVFGKMIMVKNDGIRAANAANGRRSTRELAVEKVKLSLMRIKAADNNVHGEIVPVWDFWGTTNSYADEQSQGNASYGVLLTVNAIDGTVVDRELGY